MSAGITKDDFIDASNQVAPVCECGHTAAEHEPEVEWFDGHTGSIVWHHCLYLTCRCLRYTIPEKELNAGL